MQHTFTVTGMTCGHCVMTVTEAIGEVDGVVAVDVDLATGATLVRGDDVDEAAVKAAITGVGYGIA